LFKGQKLILNLLEKIIVIKSFQRHYSELSVSELLFIYLQEKIMEQDFKIYDKETEKKFDKLGIPYVWYTLFNSGETLAFIF
jgi:hypothetical protein